LARSASSERRLVRVRDGTVREQPVPLEGVADRVQRASGGRDEGDGGFATQDLDVALVDAALAVHERAVEVEAEHQFRHGIPSPAATRSNDCLFRPGPG
jgi:hypothetical protein